MRANPPGASQQPRRRQRRVTSSLQSLKSSFGPTRGRAGGCFNDQIRVRTIMSVDEGVTRWLRQLEVGDQDAARLLWQRYYRELVELARARLGQTPRRIADEEDI